MQTEPSPPTRSWRQKFHDAFRGARAGIRDQSSFTVHFFIAAAVVIAAALLPVDRTEWSLLLLCITLVLSAEMFNSALESMARAVSSQPNRDVGNALDIASAAVLVAALGATIVGTLVFAHRVGAIWGWW